MMFDSAKHARRDSYGVPRVDEPSLATSPYMYGQRKRHAALIVPAPPTGAGRRARTVLTSDDRLTGLTHDGAL